MYLRCITHDVPVTDKGDHFWCPEGHKVHAVNMDVVLAGCVLALVEPCAA